MQKLFHIGSALLLGVLIYIGAAAARYVAIKIALSGLKDESRRRAGYLADNS